MEFEELLAVLRRGPLEERRRAYWALSERAEAGLSEAEQRKLLAWAAQPLPAIEAADGSAALIALAGLRPRPGLIAVVERIYGRLPSRQARAHALDLLNGLTGRAAAEAYAGLLRDYDPAGSVETLAAGGLVELPRHATVLFPLLFRWVDHPAFRTEVMELALAYARAGLLDARRLAPGATAWLAGLAELAAEGRAAARLGDERWRWSAAYRPVREGMRALLELAGFLPGPVSQAPLQEALQSPDPALRFTALRALARLGDPFAMLGETRAAVLLAGLGGDLETRAALHRWLAGRAELDRMPGLLREEQAVATGALAERLMRTTGLDEPPGEIELVVTLIAPEPAGGRYHLFRFRYDAGHPAAARGWIAGLAGPFHQATIAPDCVATALEPWGLRTPAEHLRQLRGR